MISGSIDARVVTRVLKDVPKEVKRAIVQDSKGIGQDLVLTIRADPGVAPYQRVYSKLGNTAKVRTRAGRPPEVVVGGSGKLSGGASLSLIARPYEFGAKTGDLNKGNIKYKSHKKRNTPRPKRQFPPKTNDGMWLNEICRDYEKGPLLDQWIKLVDDALGRAEG